MSGPGRVAGNTAQFGGWRDAKLSHATAERRFHCASLLAGSAQSGYAAEAKAAEAKAAVVTQAGADAGKWGMYGHGYDNSRFSPLTQITGKNVSKMKLVFSMQLGSLRSNGSSPLVIGDTMCVSTSWGPKYVYALDARTGQIKYEPEMATGTLQYACCDVNNRGVTYAGGNRPAQPVRRPSGEARTW